MFSRRRRVGIIREIAPDEIFLDSSNLPFRDDPQFEGRVVRPISARAILGVGAVFCMAILLFAARSFDLSVVQGASFAEVSRENRLDHTVLFAPRGLIYDRNGTELAWNESSGATSSVPYALRRYIALPGFAHILGFVNYPKADASGNWWRTEYAGVDGAELAFDAALAGKNGARMVEIDALGNVEMQNIVDPPVPGENVALSIDAALQTKLFTTLSEHARRQRFEGGAGILMDVRTGEIIAMASFPEYDNAAFAAGDAARIAEANTHPYAPLLNRATSGLYTPGSIVKPIFAAAALNEGIISPEKQIHSIGAITLPNPYDPSNPSVFRDWTVHGWVDMRTALAVSSDEYFYTIGGGYGSQIGLGIARLDAYATDFGLGTSTGFTLFGEKIGVIPTPAWKAEVFGEDDPWRIGNTYHTSIGQYGFQVTPMQAVRFTAAIANGGLLLTPQILKGEPASAVRVGVAGDHLRVVREGMRMAVTSTRSDATVKSLNIPGIDISAKTGTAEVGSRKQYINSWSVGYWPAEAPRYAYAAVLEKAPAGTLSGAAPALRPFFEWLVAEHPEYLE